MKLGKLNGSGKMNLMNSEQLGELFAALSKAQGKLRMAKKDSQNPFFKSKYATLESCWDCCRDALTENNLSVSQVIQSDETGKMSLTTVLGHSSGQYMCSVIPILLNKMDPQSLGSAISYMRRYSLCAIVGITTGEDDDGEKAMEVYRNPPEVKPMDHEEFLIKLKEAMPDEEFLGMKDYLDHLSTSRSVPVQKIMEQAVTPPLIKRFCEGWKKWNKE